MILKLSPQARENDKIWYDLTEGKVTSTINDVSDTFDFTNMPDGELQVWDDEGNYLIETELNEVPILSAEKIDGVLTVEILFTIGLEEKDERLLFPEPMTLNEFKDLMAEIVERDKPEEDESDGEDGLERQ